MEYEYMYVKYLCMSICIICFDWIIFLVKENVLTIL